MEFRKEIGCEFETILLVRELDAFEVKRWGWAVLHSWSRGLRFS